MLDHLPDVCVQDREQDRYLGVEIMIERAARQLAGIRFMATRLTKNLAAPRNQCTLKIGSAHVIHSPSVSPTIELWSQGVA